MLVGHHQEQYARILFMIFAVIAAILCVYQIIFLQKLRLLPVYLLPLLSFFICYENIILYYSDNLSSRSNEAYATYLFHSLEIPLFITVLFEMVYRLHELRTAHFFFVPFDEGPEVVFIPATVLVSVVRILVVGLFVMNILSDFEFVSIPSNNATGGYAYLAKHRNSEGLILHLVPTLVLSAVAIFLGIGMYRYGNRMTFQTSNNQFWKLLLICGFGYFVTHIFGPSVYAWTSNLGSISLLLSSTVLIQLVQDDLELARKYVDFLRRSNCAFHDIEENRTGSSSRTVRMESMNMGTTEELHANKSDPIAPRISMSVIFPQATDPMIVELSPNSDAKRRQLKSKFPFSSVEVPPNGEDTEKASAISIASSWESPKNSPTSSVAKEPDFQDENLATIAKAVLSKETYLPL